MKINSARNVNDAFHGGMRLLGACAVPTSSRAGDVLALDVPVTTIYHSPCERVLFSAVRDANPFFHFMEGLWMIAGRDDVYWISQFSSNIAQFSDDGLIFHGAYGHRWRGHWVKETVFEDKELGLSAAEYNSLDQLAIAAQMLIENPQERRAVIGMYDPSVDLGRKGKDIPCNTTIMFSRNITTDRLDMTVTNRSNDAIWGAHGANAVHFSMLQEVMAAWIGIKVGTYYQVSNNYHAYVSVYEKHKEALQENFYNYYQEGYNLRPYPMVNTDIDTWMGDLNMFMSEGPVTGFRDKFFRKVVTPIWNSYFAFKNKEDPDRVDTAIHIARGIAAQDWRVAIIEWLERRQK